MMDGGGRLAGALKSNAHSTMVSLGRQSKPGVRALLAVVGPKRMRKPNMDNGPAMRRPAGPVNSGRSRS